MGLLQNFFVQNGSIIEQSFTPPFQYTVVYLPEHMSIRRILQRPAFSSSSRPPTVRQRLLQQRPLQRS